MLVTLLAGALAASVLLCLLYRQLARRWQILDQPNERSAHRLPVPRGAGVAIIAVWSLALVTASMLPALDAPLPVALLVLSLILAGIGFWDDIRGLSAGLRMALYAFVAVAYLLTSVSISLPLWPLALLYLLWLSNLYNFMDGIDAIAATEAVFVGVSAAALGYGLGGPSAQWLPALLLAVCALGFLLLNWPPASIFMGDSGSITIGFIFAALSLGSLEGPGMTFYSWLILLAGFVTDSSYTLLQRAARGENLAVAHNLHLYQRLSRRWSGSRRVVLTLLLANVAWLLPLAVAASVWPGMGLGLTVLAYLPLIVVMHKMVKLT